MQNIAYIFLVFALNIIPKINAKPIAAAIPAATASNPPENIPKIPFDSTAAIAPRASEAPKPIIGKFIPALQNSDIGSNICIASKTTPKTTNVTKILALVNFVLIINI